MLNNTISFIEFIHWYIEILSTNISRGIMELSKSPAGDRKSKGQWRHGLWFQIYASALYNYDVVALRNFDHRKF